MTQGYEPFTRVLLTLEYDGTDFCGWQRQAAQRSVQQELENALYKATGRETPVTGASRTDAGVHALGQCAHFDSYCTIPPDKYPFVLNRLLPQDVRVRSSRAVPETFHARFWSCGKIYTYRIHNHRQDSALFRHAFAHVPLPLDENGMNEAAQLLLGTHDFKAFAATGSEAKTTVRTILSASVSRSCDDVILLIRGNAFLYNMVRIIAGTLIEIGHGKLPASSILEAIETGDRLKLGPTAPARGLELTQVFYPDGPLAAGFPFKQEI